MATICGVKVHSLAGNSLRDAEKRHADRQTCVIEATSRPLDVDDAMSWGARVKDISAGGLKLVLCFPFSPGTYLNVDLEFHGLAASRALVCRVVHVHDHADGTWTLGCEFIKPLADSDLELLI